MALTNQQVQQVFLAITGRPAEGSAVAWGANSLSVAALANAVVDIRKGADFTNSKEAFVENLYTQLLGRPSDTEGKEFWLEALNNGASYGDVLSQFVNAVLAQPSSADLYTLQNKLSIAEKISAQVNTFQGGAAAEQSLKDIMTNVDANTTAETADSLISDFKAQNVDIANVTVKPGAEEATKGSDEHATVFNASITLGGDAISIEGSSSFADTLNLSVKGVKDEQTELNNIGTVSGIKTLNITTGSNVNTVTLGTDNIGGAKDLTIKGSAKSNIEVAAGNNVSSITTGTASDYINISNATNAVTVNGGAGIDTVEIGANSAKATLVSIEKIAGTGNLSVAQLNGKTFTLGYKEDTTTKNAVITIDKVGSSGLNLSNLKITDGTTNTFALNDVKGGTIKLIKTDSLNNKTVDTITLDSTAKNVTVNNVEAGDKINFASILTLTANEKAVKLGGGNATGTAYTITDNKVNFVNAGKNITNVDDAFTFLKNGDTKITVTAKDEALIAFVNGNNSYLFAAKETATSTTLTKEMIKFIGKVDNAIDDNDGIGTTAGVLEFV